MNKSISNLHQEILDSDRKKVLDELTPFTKDYILGGGTALALQLAHRKSFDFDFFSEKSIQKNLLQQVSKIIPIANVSQDTSNELTFFTKSEVKITFLHYPFTYLFPLVEFDNLSLFSIQDIAIKKAYTIGRRGEYRDYFDLYTILRNKLMELSELVKNTKKTYGSVFEEKIFLQQLVYFGDLLNFEIIPAELPIPKPEEVKHFFETLVKESL